MVGGADAGTTNSTVSSTILRDNMSYTAYPLNFVAVGKFNGLVAAGASVAAQASLRLPHGVAPTTPVNGDMWTTSAGGLFVRINGVTKTVTLT